MAVRSVADWVLLPPKNLLEHVGDTMVLTGKTVLSTLRPPYPYGGEFVQQFPLPHAVVLDAAHRLDHRQLLRRGRPSGRQRADSVRPIDRLGGFFVLAAIREIGPNVTAIILAGVGGTAITADLGARKIREELDALQVLGVHPIKNLVVPRFLALMVVTGLFNIWAIVLVLGRHARVDHL